MDSLDTSSKYVKDKMDNRSIFISSYNKKIYTNIRSHFLKDLHWKRISSDSTAFVYTTTGLKPLLSGRLSFR